ncbi:MAG: family metallopeptidase [Mucilaginibacter sp.]|nr:family metallopeptidase [Mucilaginibacter sp.]
MKSLFWTPFISDHTVKAICWTLIHSLWIGLAIALLAGLVIIVTRKSSAVLRYRLLCSILVLFVTAVSIAFYLEMRFVGIVRSSPYTSRIAVNINTVASAADAAGQASPVERVVTFFNRYTNVIFMVWLVFSTIKSLKMMSGLLYIQRLRKYKVHAVAEELECKVALFCKRIGIRQKVDLLQSELVKVPVAIGWLKPVILLPMGIILQLSTEQLESILWHELAHIRRRDYLVNILQELVETVFFFNPGLLWLSSLIRDEREACCDDMVLSRLNRKTNYLEALLAFGSGNNNTVFMMSLGSGNQLRHRLKRMVNQENKRLSVTEKIVLAAGLILLSAFTILPKANHAAAGYLSHFISKKPALVITAKPVVVISVVKKRPLLLYPKRRFTVDTNVKKADTTIRFTSVLFNQTNEDLANCELKAKDDKGNIYHMIVANNKLTALEINNVKANDNELAGYDYLIRSINRQMSEKRRVRTEDIAGLKANSPAAKFKPENPDAIGKKKHVLNWQKADTAAIKHYAKQKNGAVTLPDPRFMKADAMRKRRQQDSSNYAAEQERAHNLIADLVKEKTVSDPASVQWFGLSDTELIVNGQKQPEALQQKLKTKYGIHENYGLYYGPVKMTGTGVFIDNDKR